MLKNLIFLFILGVLTHNLALAGKIDKGFVALSAKDYFKAKGNFEKSLIKLESPASFGLASIFSRNDNPFHSLDSAYRYIHRSKNSYAKVPQKTLQKLYVYGYDEATIHELMQTISSEFYKIALQQNSIEGYQNFIEKHPNAKEYNDAIYKRDSIAFEETKKQNSAMAFANFNATYPKSTFVAAGNELLTDAQYRETTTNGTIQEYETYLAVFPENKYQEDAEDKIYQLSTKSNTVESLESFLKKYPSNKNVNAAWERLYQLSVFEYSAESIAQFSIKYPDYPFFDNLRSDLNSIELLLFPFESNGKYGYFDVYGKTIIEAAYSSTGQFKEGLALVSKNDKYGYINKKGEIVVPLKFDGGLDFEKGRAIVEKSDRYGMIDRTGVEVMPPDFEDLGNISEDLIFGLKDSLFGYYNTMGKQVIPERFTEAFSFSDGVAKVEEKGFQALIDKKGKYVVHPAFREVSSFTDSLMIFGNNDFYGLMKRSCEIVVPNKYETIGELSYGLAIVVDKGLIGYINERGETVIPPTFDVIPNFLERCQFKEGAAVVSKNGQYGIINTKGTPIIPFKYDELGQWADLIAARKKLKWGYINRGNQFVIQPIFDFAESFVGLVGLVEEVSLSGVVNKKGEKIIETGYTNVEIIQKDYLMVNNGALFGIYTMRGEQILPMIYSSIRVFDEIYLILVNMDGISYFNTKTGNLLSWQGKDE